MIGLSTYAFFWEHSARSPHPLSLVGAFEATHSLGVDLFQICDYAPLEVMGERELADAADAASDLGLTVQLGTKGIDRTTLDRYLRLAGIFDARLVRSMLHGPHSRPDLIESERMLREAMPVFEASGVSLALETYEQVATAELVRLVERIDSPVLGVCLDPANVVARLESPRAAIKSAAAVVSNIHAKDFAFARQPGWVGFAYSGARMGTGLHDYPYLLRTVRPRERGIDEIVEHWLPWQDDPETTIRIEREWTRSALDYLRSTL